MRALLIVLLALAACRVSAPSETGTRESRIELFNGRDLSGWREVGDAVWRVENGELVGEVGGGAQSFLVTEREFGDFRLELELRNDGPGNSGVQVRSHQKPSGQVYGYQIEIDPSSRAWSGGLYDEGRRGWLQNLADNDAARAAFKLGEWNRYRIELVGPRIRTWVNDVPVVDFTDDADASGFIALQVHSGKTTRMRWRRIELVELGR